MKVSHAFAIVGLLGLAGLLLVPAGAARSAHPSGETVAPASQGPGASDTRVGLTPPRTEPPRAHPCGPILRSADDILELPSTPDRSYTCRSFPWEDPDASQRERKARTVSNKIHSTARQIYISTRLRERGHSARAGLRRPYRKF